MEGSQGMTFWEVDILPGVSKTFLEVIVLICWELVSYQTYLSDFLPVYFMAHWPLNALKMLQMGETLFVH